MTTKIKLLRLVTNAAFAVLAAGPLAGQSSGSVDRFRGNLEGDGFAVREGSVQYFDPIPRYCSGEIPNAFYGNKGAPYVVGIVPGSPRGGASTPLPFEFRLAPDEAVVLIGLTPPSEQYFSYQAYLGHRWDPPKSKPDFLDKDFLGNSLGDAVNLRTIRTTGPTPFNRPVVLIFTPDQGIEARVRSALRRAGYPEAILNTVVLPSSLLKLGLGATSDTLYVLHRNALFTDPSAGERYIAQPTLRVFRATPTNTAAPNPFPVPPLRVRGSGRSELELTPAVARLRQAILSRHSGLTATDYHAHQTGNDGYDYTQRGATAVIDTRDALYLSAGYWPEYELMDDKVTLGDDEFLIAYGVNHPAAAKATYTNINVYATETAKLALGSVFSPDLKGSAQQYLDAGDPAADLLYAYKISRSCAQGERFCLQIKAPDNCSIFTLDANTALGLFFRIYLEPETHVGLAYGEVLYDRVLKLSPKP